MEQSKKLSGGSGGHLARTTGKGKGGRLAESLLYSALLPNRPPKLQLAVLLACC